MNVITEKYWCARNDAENKNMGFHNDVGIII